MTSRADRDRHVTQMLANSRLEDMEPDQAHHLLLKGYVEGAVTLKDLLQHAGEFAIHHVTASMGGAEIPYDDLYEEYQKENAQPAKQETENPEVTAFVNSFFSKNCG